MNSLRILQGKRLEEFLTFNTRQELLEAFSSPWLEQILPGINLLPGCTHGPGRHLEGDVAEHTSYVYENFRSIIKKRLGREASFEERLAVVLHDIKKPETRTEMPDGSVHFPGHEAAATLAIPLYAERIGLSSSELEKLTFLVAEHGTIHQFPDLSAAQQQELLSSPYCKELCILQEADAVSCIFPDGSTLPVHWELLFGQQASRSVS